MDNLLISIVSIVIGVIATLWISSHYFTRSTSKALTPFIQFFTSVFRGVDPSVRDSLKIAYKGTPITDLFEIQFLVANTGQRPIRDLIKPLTLKVPEGTTVLDVSILHIHPEGREVSIEVADSNVVFVFPLLNSKDFFITKLLLHGNPGPGDFTFTISGDDLPPSLTPQLLSPSSIATDEKRAFEPGALASGLFLLLLGASFANLIYEQWPTISEIWTIGLASTFKANWITLLSSLIAGIPTLLLLVAGTMLIIGSFTNFSFPRRDRFRIPSDHMRDPFFRLQREFLYTKSDKNS